MFYLAHLAQARTALKKISIAIRSYADSGKEVSIYP